MFFDYFMEAAQLDNDQLFVERMKEVTKSLPRPVFVVLRYLFHFLNQYGFFFLFYLLKYFNFLFHFCSLSEYSEENMMDHVSCLIFNFF